jgi:hypothetical protein
MIPGEEDIVHIPPNINTWQLGKLLDEDPLSLLHLIQEHTNEIVTDEF